MSKSRHLLEKLTDYTLSRIFNDFSLGYVLEFKTSWGDTIEWIVSELVFEGCDFKLDENTKKVPQNILKLVGQRIKDVQLNDNGSLIIELANGSKLVHQPNDKIEAWELRCHLPITFAALPGGGWDSW